MVGEKVVYVEPDTKLAELYGFKDALGNVHQMQVPLEDLCISMNLMVEVRGRSMQSATNDGNRVLIMSWEGKGDKQNVNFMAGSRLHVDTKEGSGYINALTTNYTDIFIDEIRQGYGTSEMFGIRSVDVEYNNFMVPEVNIEFVDIRGASLFAQEETRYGSMMPGDSPEYDIAKSFFRCFFTFPYPKFTLMLKGFYGKPVSYELTCADFKSRFDCETGNFNATAKFVGYSYSFLNDVAVTALFAAPFSDYLGEKYWETRKMQEKGFRVYDKNGNSHEMPRLLEIYVSLQQLYKEAARIARQDEGVVDSEIISAARDDLRKVEGAYNTFVESVDDWFSKYEKEEVSYDYVVNDARKRGIEVPADSKDDDPEKKIRHYFKGYPLGNSQPNSFIIIMNEVMSKDDGGDSTVILDKSTQEAYNNLVTEIDNFNKAHGGDGYTLKRLIGGIHGHFRKQANLLSMKYLPEKVRLANGDIYNTYLKKDEYAKLRRDIQHALDEADRLVKVYKIGHPYDVRSPHDPNVQYSPAIFFDNGLVKSMVDVSARLSADKETFDKVVETKYEEATRNLLNFEPSVQNFTKIVMAHFETLMYMMGETVRDITASGEARRADNLGLTRENLADVKDSDTFIVPPFPRVVEKKVDENRETMTDTWIGNYNGDFREKDLVYGILNGVSRIKNITNAVTAAKEADGPKSGLMVKIPATPLDVTLGNSPYDGIDINNTSDLFGRVGLRMASELSEMNCLGYDASKYARTYGTIEAANFAAKYPSPSADFLAKLNGNTLTGDYIVKILTGDAAAEAEKKDNKWAWDSPKVTSSSGLFKQISGEDGNEWLYITKYKTEHEIIVPIQGKTFADAERELRPDAEGKCTRPSSMQGYQALADLGYDTNNDSILTISTDLEKYADMVNKSVIRDYDISAVSKLVGADYDGAAYKPFYESRSLCAKFGIVQEPSEGNRLLPNIKRDKDTMKAAKLFGGNGEKDVFVDGNYVRFYNTNSESITRETGPSTINDAFSGVKPISDANTISSFKGITSSGELTNKCSLFGQKLYYDAPTEVRGIYFLRSICDNIDIPKVAQAMIPNKYRRPIILPYAAALYVCGLVWLKRQIESGTAPNCVIKPLNIPTERKDMLRIMADTFTKWVYGEFSTNIAPKLELNFRGGKDFSAMMMDMCPKGYVTDEGMDASVNMGVEQYVSEYLDPSFLENYISIGSKTIVSDGGGILLANRESGRGITLATDLCVKPCVYSVNITEQSAKGHIVPMVYKGSAVKFMEAFVTQLRKEYEGVVLSVDVQPVQQASDPNTDENICIGVYKYLKNIHDKWIAGSVEDISSKFTMQQFFYDENPYFYFIDSFYNVLPENAVINLRDFMDRIEAVQKQDGYTLLSLLSDIYSKNKFMFLCLQNFMDMSKPENMDDMFRPIPYLEARPPENHPNFIVMYPYEPSSKLNIPSEEYSDDSYMIAYDSRQTWPKPLQTSTGYQLPAFGVAYGKQYQSYFTNINVSMDAPMATEQTIRTQFQIASQQSTNASNLGTGAKEAIAAGQDLYSIYSQNSYTCEVDMLGCAWVQPMMYFCLLNVPMYRGTYMIVKVKHSMEAGFMRTHFTGVRMSKYANKINDKAFYSTNGGAMGGTADDGTWEDVYFDGNENNTVCEYTTFPKDSTTENEPVTYQPTDVPKSDKSYYLNKKVGQLPIKNIGNCPKTVSVRNALAGLLQQEAGGEDEMGKLGVAAAIYNRIFLNGEQNDTNAKTTVYNVLQFAGWKDAPVGYFTSPAPACVKVIEKIFKNGPASVLSGKHFTFYLNPELGKNNQKFNIKKGDNMITPEMAVSIYHFGPVRVWNNESSRLHNKKTKGNYIYLVCQLGGQKGQVFCCEEKIANRAINNLHSSKKSIPQKVEVKKKTTDILSNEGRALYNSVKRTVDESPSLGFKLNDASGKGDMVIFTGERLSDVFDVILNGYPDRIKYLYWDAGTANGVQNPEPSRVIAMAGSTASLSIRIQYSEGAQTVVPRLTSYNQASAKFMASLKRHYGEDTKAMIKDVENFHGSTEFDMKPIDCPQCYGKDRGTTAPRNSDGTNTTMGNGGGLTPNTDNSMLGDWHIGLTRQWVQDLGYDDYVKGIHGVCATSVKWAMAKGGVPYLGSANGGTMNLFYDRSKGFEVVKTWDLRKSDGVVPQFPLQDGDIASWDWSSRTKTGGKPYGHVAIYFGGKWYSDWKQKNSRYGRNNFNGKLRLLRYTQTGHCVHPTKAIKDATTAQRVKDIKRVHKGTA